MDWWWLIAALGLVAFHVIKQILAAQQEAAAQRERLATPAPPLLASRTDEDVAKEKTELDRRIEEAVERREPRVERITVKRSLPMPAPPIVRPAPRYVPPATDDSPRMAEATRPARSPLPRRELPRPPSAIPVQVPAPEAPKLAAMMAPPAPPAVFVPASPETRSPALKQTIEMLKERRSLAAAVILREILDRPLSRRRRR
jgi:hypothetical protein